MRSICLLLISLSFGTVATEAFGQVILLDKTADYLKQKNLSAAREAIELAVKNETTKNEARTWYLRGFVYKELYKQNSSEPTHRETAVEALHKSVSLDARKEFVNSSNASLDYLYGTYYNEGIDLINAKEYDKALRGLRRFIEHRAKTKPDAYYAEALYYAGVANNATGKKNEAQQCFEQALAKGYNNPILYDDLSQVYLANNNRAKALSTIETGRKAFPTDAALRTAEINLALQMKEYVRAEKLIDEHLAANPTDTETPLGRRRILRNARLFIRKFLPKTRTTSSPTTTSAWPITTKPFRY